MIKEENTRERGLKNLLLALASILATLLVLEGVFRVLGHLENRGLLETEKPLAVDPPENGPADLGHMIRLSENRRIIYELKGGLDVLYRGTRVKTDVHGFRSPSGPAELGKAGYRIVGIGDSFMFGQSVEVGESYLAVLEKRLRRLRPDLDARILNTAVPGYNTAMEIATLREKALSYRPDLVIIEFVGNDFHLPNFIRTHNDVLTPERSYLFDFVERRLGRREEDTLFDRLERLGLEPGLRVEERRVPPEYRDMVGFDSYIRSMRELRDLALENEFDVLSITLIPPGSVQTNVMSVSVDLGFHVLHVGEVFEGYLADRGLGEYLGSPLSLAADDGHPSPLGHRVAAGALYRYLENYLLPSP